MKTRKILLPLLITFSSMIGLAGCGNQNEEEHHEEPPVVITTVDVTGVEFKEKAFSLAIGETYSSVIKVLPNNATNKAVTYVSNKPSIASVDENGAITGLKEGSATITVKTEDGGFTDTCTVNVIDPYMKKMTVSYNNAMFTATPNTNRCHVGDEITITISKLNGGYTFDEFTAEDAVYNTEVELTKVDNKTYKCKAPKSCQIRIIEHATGKPIKIYYNDEHDLISGVRQSVNGGDYTEVTEKGNDSGVTYYKVTYGASVEFSFEEKNYWNPTSIILDDTEIELIDYKVIFNAKLDSFFDESDFFLSMTVNSEKITPPENPESISVSGGVSFEASVYASNKTTPITQAYPGDKVYVKVNLKAGKSGEVDDVVLNYEVMANYTKYLSATNEGEGWYSFIVPNSYNDTIKGSISKYSANRFASYSSIVGEYVTLSVNAETTQISELSDKTVVIQNDGRIIYDGKTTCSSAISSGKITTTHKQVLTFGEGWFLFNFTDEMTSHSNREAILAVKKENASDLLSAYSVSGERFTVSDKSYMAIMVNKDGVQYNSAFFNFTDNETHLGVAFDLMNGETIFDDKAIYYVKHGGSTVIGFGYDMNGKCLIEAPMGVYTCGDNKIIIPNGYVAYIGENRYSWTIESNTLTLSNRLETIVLNINASDMTYVEVSRGEGRTTIDLVGTEFRYYDGTSSAVSNLVLSFESIEGTTYKGTFTYYYTSSNAYVFGFDATVNSDGEVEVVLKTQNIPIYNAEKLEEGHYKFHGQLSDGKITLLDDLLYFDNMEGKVLSCDKFIY